MLFQEILRWARLKVIKEMLDNKKKIIVTSIDAFAAVYTPRNYIKIIALH